MDKHERFNEIYNEFKERIFAFISVKLQNESDRWDVFQEVFAKVFEKINELDSSLNIKSYIYTIAKNKITDYFRNNKIEMLDISEFENQVLENTNESAIQRNNDLLKALDCLTAREKEVFEYKYFFNFKISEISEKLGLTEGAVKRYLFDATLKLKERLK
ncbi:MAG TPA: sigma-70 family RNA polymerase sigma factor [bacterium]|nr:sigma-70 family RNA polymerase sigma factor [bacterium]